MGWLKLVHSRKFWLMVGACVAAAVTGRPELIPGIIMANVAAIAAEDCARKIGVKDTLPEESKVG